MVPSASLVPIVKPTLWLSMMVWANQLVRSSGPSTVSLKSFWALIWSSQLIGGVRSEAPSAASLNASVMSGALWNPARDLTLPLRTSNQRPTSSSRALICATRLRSHRRWRNFSCRRACSFINCAKLHRMAENFAVATLMGLLLAADPEKLPTCRVPSRCRARPIDPAIMIANYRSRNQFPHAFGNPRSLLLRQLCPYMALDRRRIGRPHALAQSKALVADCHPIGARIIRAAFATNQLFAFKPVDQP